MRNLFHTLIKPIIVVSIVLKVSVAVGILFNAIVSFFFSVITPTTFMQVFHSNVMICLSTMLAIATIIWSFTEIVFTTINKK